MENISYSQRKSNCQKFGEHLDSKRKSNCLRVDTRSSPHSTRTSVAGDATRSKPSRRRFSRLTAKKPRVCCVAKRLKRRGRRGKYESRRFFSVPRFFRYPQQLSCVSSAAFGAVCRASVHTPPNLRSSDPCLLGRKELLFHVVLRQFLYVSRQKRMYSKTGLKNCSHHLEAIHIPSLQASHNQGALSSLECQRPANVPTEVHH